MFEMNKADKRLLNSLFKEKAIIFVNLDSKTLRIGNIHESICADY